jgi:hypothetical protein
MANSIEYLDRPPAGWFALDVLKNDGRKWDWAALMADVDFDDLKNCTCDFPVLFLVHPKDYRPGPHKVQQAFVRIPGKHRTWDDAWQAIHNMIAATRH